MRTLRFLSLLVLSVALRVDSYAAVYEVGPGKPLASIGAVPWATLQPGDTDVVRGRRITSWPSLAVDFRNAGVTWTDERLVVDTDGPFPLISSRKPADLPAFCDELVAQLEKV